MVWSWDFVTIYDHRTVSYDFDPPCDSTWKMFDISYTKLTAPLLESSPRS